MEEPIFWMGSRAYLRFPAFIFKLVTNLLIGQNDVAVELITSFQQIL